MADTAVAEAPPQEPAPATPAPQADAAVKDKGKDKKAKKDKKGKGGEELDASGEPSIAAHPRAARAVSRAKSWGGLGGFLLAGYLSLPTGTIAEAGARALLAGIVGYVAVWAGAVFVWRRLVVLEVKAREQQLIAAAQPAAAPAPGARETRAAGKSR